MRSILTQREFKILAIDGGGIRGVCPAAYLKFFQDRLTHSLRDYFDLLVGASTGGFIAVSLALGKSIGEILQLYEAKGRYIFRPVSRGLLKPKYDLQVIAGILKEFFGESVTLADARCRVCVPAVDLHRARTVVFKTRHLNSNANISDIPAWQITAAASAAPYYFEPFRTITGLNTDGSLWANNPSLVALTEALYLGYQTGEIKILSIGTGARRFHKKQTRFGFGILGWGRQLIDLILQTQSDSAVNITTILCKDHYKRIQIDLPQAVSFELDEYRKIPELKSYAEARARETFEEVSAVFFRNTVPPFVGSHHR